MVKNHLKRLTIPRTWNLKRKGIRFALRPKSGKQQEYALPLGTVLKEMTHICATSREAKALLQNKAIVADGKVRHDIHYPVGLFETVTLAQSKKSYRVTLDTKGRLAVITCTDADTLLCKITGKTTLGKQSVQINCLNGKNFTVDKDTYKTGDVIVVKDNKVTKHLPLQNGALCLLTAGKHAGTLATITNVDADTISVKTDNDEFDTLRAYAFVVGQTKPEITVRGDAA